MARLNSIDDVVDAMSGHAYMGHVKELGCRICERLGHPDTPAHAHHPRRLGGLRKLLDKQTIALCDLHHVGADGIHTIGREGFEERFGIGEYGLSTECRDLIKARLKRNVRYAHLPLSA